MKAWRWWVSCCARRSDPFVLALVRILVCVTIVGDLLRGAWLGLLPWLWRPFSEGGLSTVQSPYALIDNIAPVHGGPVLVGVTVAALSLAALGVATRPAMVVGLVAYSQLGHLYPPGDRAVDRLLRTVLLILLFSGSHLCLSLQRRLRGQPVVRSAPAWPGELIVFVLVLVYLSAGIHKLGSSLSWLTLDGRPMLHRILTNPLSSRLSVAFADAWMPVIRLLSMGTIVLECSAFLLWTRLRPWWALGGVAMHIGIAATMHLGAFSFGMLALYPVLFAPWILARRSTTHGGSG